MSSRDRLVDAAVELGAQSISPTYDCPQVRGAMGDAVNYALDAFGDNLQHSLKPEYQWIHDRLGDALLLLTANRPKCPYVGEFLDDELTQSFLETYARQKVERESRERKESSDNPD